MMTFEQLARLLAESAERVRPTLLKDAAEIGELQVQLAKHEIIGHQLPMWPPLADSTIEDKQRHGYEVPHPLLRTGKLRDSVKADVDVTAVGVSVTIGSDDKVAVFQELGTSTIPPRPFLATATMDAMDRAEKILADSAVALLTPKK